MPKINFPEKNKNILIVTLFILCLIFGSISFYYFSKRGFKISYQILSEAAVNKCKLPEYRGNASETECLNLAIKKSNIYNYYKDEELLSFLKKYKLFENKDKLPKNEAECDMAIEEYKEKISDAYNSGNQSEYKRLNNESKKVVNHCLNIINNE